MVGDALQYVIDTKTLAVGDGEGLGRGGAFAARICAGCDVGAMAP
jgi:hypothetical protein